MKDKMMEPEVKIDNGELATSMIPEDFTEPEVLFQKLISMVKKYHPSDDVHLIEKAYKIAYKAHEGQKRKSGEPYIIHPVCVCIILAELELDKETIVAGMLHDVVEDTIMTSEEIKNMSFEDFRTQIEGMEEVQKLTADGTERYGIYKHDVCYVNRDGIERTLQMIVPETKA